MTSWIHAGLLTTLNSTNLEFITEPEAVVLRCLNVVNLRSGGDDAHVDKGLSRWLGRKVRFQALGKLKRCNYGQIQKLIQRSFYLWVKFKFNGEPREFKQKMKEAGWILINFYILDNDVSNELKQLISLQNNLKSLEIYDNIWTNIIPVLAKYSNTLTKLYFCNVSDEDNDIPLSFIGSFKNLQEIIFSFSADQVSIIAVNGSSRCYIYGLNVEIVQENVLKWTYGEVFQSLVACKEKKNGKSITL
ncbi:hypothetical protein RhiirA4_453230 [Rhizophagus irregularis]|uniref:Uncharacterized protein n=1 Tax=Rhizophagus irregularis TaxID=588596 RepID=A0A2I1FZX2_9GLOM|nr:hypothetical protein RhiirA4_453230 [Rhizophagus irregularis]